jgi:hypothetical protein
VSLLAESFIILVVLHLIGKGVKRLVLWLENRNVVLRRVYPGMQEYEEMDDEAVELARGA